jgi:hypothetical protein
MESEAGDNLSPATIDGKGGQQVKQMIIGSMVVIILLAAVLDTVAEESLKKSASKECLMSGLAVKPPHPWYSVQIEAGDPGIDGCQMIWEEGEHYMGIMRLLSFDSELYPPAGVKWENYLMAFEASVLEKMNFRVGKPIWKRDSVPISGEGFINAKAIGLEAKLLGVEHPNEAHFLLFEGPAHKYVISIITPAKSVSPEVYQSNTKAMGTVMRTLQPR